jgi:hypothetical protein
MDHDESVGPLAEFAALRNEIDALWKSQMQIFALQLTVVGAVFSFVLSHREQTELLLLVPVVSYLLGARYISLERGMLLIGRYIRESLSDRVPGGLGWESWWRTQDRRKEGLQGWALPLWLLFPGTAILAIAWSVTTSLHQQSLGVAAAAFAFAWLIEATLTALCISSIRQVYHLTWRAETA